MLYIVSSNRKKNSVKIAKDLATENDKILYLSEKKINYCLGCNKCFYKINHYCIQDDDMIEIYEEIIKNNEIILITPIYMNHITGILKNLIDRLNPFSNHELLKDKSIGLITVGQLSEEENQNTNNDIKKYFESLSEFFYFKFIFFDYFSSGDIIEIDDVKNNKNYEIKVNNIKKKLKSSKLK